MDVEIHDRIRVLIVDDVAETRENLRKLLSFDPDIEVVGAAATGEEGVELAKETQPHVVLMDINLPGIDGITATEHIVREVPTAQIVILSVQGETGYMRRAMAAGARDFLVKPPSGDELMSTIRRVYEIGKAQAARIAPPPSAVMGPGGREPARQGHLVAVFAPKGGVGCTTVAVNLAVTLQDRLGGSRKVAILDGNLQFGDVGVMLNLQPSRSVADLAPQIDDLDADMLTAVLTPHPSGLKALLAPPHPEAAEPLLVDDTGTGGGGGRKMRAILRQMLREFDVVVADTWGWVDEVTLTLLDEAVLILLVITPHIPAIKDVRQFMDLAGRLGYPMDKLALVINHADRPTGIRLDQIERALMPSIAHIPYDERAGAMSANRGIPVVTEGAGRPIAQAFARLAKTVSERLEELESGEEEEVVEEWASAETSRRMLGRIFGS
ncbi:MAG TPA: CobQ/CobB/MinD/ParA nucleotide binding domain-containing protein [Anaerolineales bacterium]|nr:CobQ/CobB/MinD/ParA nucleotide binding domain-containing protein [Anaerolineae bacterium]HIQ00937.1 CobQ/CobB/MinD/ParA nucleotide binding domain-containing protein [Anaerolineales bacterium]